MNFVVPMNPCPCGYYPDAERCSCTEPRVRRYMGKVSGPILDRIDLCVELESVDYESLRNRTKGESSGEIRRRVEQARQIQEARFEGSAYRFNGDIEVSAMERYCRLGEEQQRCMEQLYASLQLSARAYHRILRVARTIADLEGAEEIGVPHLMEASFYRPSTEYWGH
nr:ATP-binding protein [uncultured Acetatifactor sp.]